MLKHQPEITRVQETHVTHEVSKGTLDLSLRRPKQKNKHFKHQNTANTNAHGIEHTRRSGTSWAHWKTQNLHHELARLCWRHEFQITFILSLLHFPTWFNDSRSDSCHLGFLPFLEGTRRASMAVATVNSVRAASRFPEPSTRLALPCAMQCWTLWRSLRWTLWGCFQTLLWHEALPWQTNLQGSKLVRRFVGIVRLIPSPRWHVGSHVAVLLQVHSAKGNELPSIDVQTDPGHFLWMSHSHIGRIGHVGRMCRVRSIALLWDGWHTKARRLVVGMWWWSGWPAIRQDYAGHAYAWAHRELRLVTQDVLPSLTWGGKTDGKILGQGTANKLIGRWAQMNNNLWWWVPKFGITGWWIGLSIIHCVKNTCTLQMWMSSPTLVATYY